MLLKKVKQLIRVTLVGSIVFLLSTCTTQNTPFRTGVVSNCITNGCNDAVIEIHSKEQYDLTFVEFSERGNVFSREKLKQVIAHIEKEEKASKTGIMLLVYAHGWKHNASNIKLGNVEKFRKLLKIVSKNKISNKKVIGLYIGWRGLTLNTEPLKTLTYWGRKSTARQVGSGGVSELLLKLKRITTTNTNKNIFIISGHSFGAAVILSAMKDILISYVINTEKVAVSKCGLKESFKNTCSKGCVKTKPFGDGIILINPAVEANELLQLKELVTEERCYAKEQVKLLHVLSSNADKATRTAFKVGQYLGVSLRESEKSLDRRIFIGDSLEKKNIKLQERDLDITTIGNYSPFITGKKSNSEISKSSGCKERKEDLLVSYKACMGNGDCVKRNANENFPSSPYEPISVISTDSPFINSHTDVFNENVVAYISTVVLENQYKQTKKIPPNEPVKTHCFGKNDIPSKFDFANCEAFFRKKYIDDFCQEFDDVK